MANQSQNWILRCLSLLTPKVIEDLTSSAFHRKATLPLAAGAESETIFVNSETNDVFKAQSEDIKAKIIPFKKNEEKQDTEEFENVSEDVENDFEEEINLELSQDQLKALSKNGNLESVGIINTEKQKIIDEIHKKKAKLKEDSSTLFLIKQRSKLKNCQEKLQTQDAIKSYKKSSTEDSKSKYDEEGKPIVGSTGILVNKKHF
jgi:hypothetical protein